MKNLLAAVMFVFPAVSLAEQGGVAIAELWATSAAEYQATAEAQLEQIGARTIQQADLTGAIVAGFLQMFSGGGGAPLDLVKPSAEAFGVAPVSADGL